MNAELRQLTVEDEFCIDIYQMLQEIPKDENGFTNNCNGRTFEEYKAWLQRSDKISKGIGLESWMVPQTVYWLFIDGIPVGIGKLRHYLTDKLKAEGGHAGYAIVPSKRNMGYGKLLLKLLIEKTRDKCIDELLITAYNYNAASINVALLNGGHIERADGERHYIWIPCR